MEQYKKSSPRSPPTPASPRTRHIHSSFPHYFYSTPAAPPSSDSISAFVMLCESQRLVVDDGFAFGSSNRHTTSFENAVPPVSVAFADELFRGGKLLPVAPKAAAIEATPAQPLKPPPRLQYIANIRKSLRNLGRSSRRGGGGGTKAADNMRRDADPFAAAADKVAKEDAPWCQLPWRRKSKASHEAKAGDEDIDRATTTTTPNKSRKGSWIFRMLRSVLKGKESSSSSRDSKEEDGKNGQLVGLVRSTNVSRYRTSQYGSSLFHCLGFK